MLKAVVFIDSIFIFEFFFKKGLIPFTLSAHIGLRGCIFFLQESYYYDIYSLPVYTLSVALKYLTILDNKKKMHIRMAL